MATVPAGTRFEAIPVGTKIDLRSEQINESLSVYTIEDISGGSNQTSISSNGFKVIGAINSDILLPDNSNVQYTGPLVMGLGYSITVPLGTTLTIV
jgi:hypothetical protein